MRKHNELQEYRSRMMKNGVAHLVYYASGSDQIIHPLSVEGYELVCDDFSDFLAEYRGVLPWNAPIVLQVAGNSMTEAEQNTVDKAIMGHFLLSMNVADRKLKKNIRKCLLFLLLMVLSATLLFGVKAITGEVLTNLAYLPFYFFGYRLLIYMACDTLPLWKERKWCKQLASMKLIFTDDDEPLSELQNPESIKSEVKEYSRVSEKAISNKFAEIYLMEQEIVSLQCNVSSIEDVILQPLLNGREYISPMLAGYLGLVEYYFSDKNPITLTLSGKSFSEEEKKRIRAAVDAYYLRCIASERVLHHENNAKILFFAICSALSIIALVIWGTSTNVAMHEFLILLFWFFCDYMLEFLLIDTSDIRKKQKILQNCRKMTLAFSTEEKQ